MVDAATVPLKVLISDMVTNVLYAAGYPIAQNGVVIQIGPYQLLVQDACSGMNSIFALSAIGVFYVYAFPVARKAPGTDPFVAHHSNHNHRQLFCGSFCSSYRLLRRNRAWSTGCCMI